MQEGFGFRLPEERNLYSVKDIDKNDKFILGLSKYPYIWSRKTKDTSNGYLKLHTSLGEYYRFLRVDNLKETKYIFSLVDALSNILYSDYQTQDSEDGFNLAAWTVGCTVKRGCNPVEVYVSDSLLYSRWEYGYVSDYDTIQTLTHGDSKWWESEIKSRYKDIVPPLNSIQKSLKLNGVSVDTVFVHFNTKIMEQVLRGEDWDGTVYTGFFSSLDQTVDLGIIVI